MLNRTSVVGLALLMIVAVVALSACADRGTVKIAAQGPFTGEVAKIGLDALNAVRLAVEDFNARGGPVKVELVVADDEASPARSLSVGERLVADRSVMGVIGPMTSGTTAAVLPVFEKASLAVVSQSATNPDLTEGGYRVMHRVCPRDDAQGPAAADFIHSQLGARRVYVIDDKGAYGVGLADQVSARLQQHGVTVVRGQIAQTDRDFAAMLTQVKGHTPDLLYLAIQNPAQAAAILKQMHALGLRCQVMGGDGIGEREELIAGASGLAEGVYVTSLGPSLKSTPGGRQFAERFEAKYGPMSIFTGQSYDAAMALLEAIGRAAAAGKVTRESVLEALKSVRYEGVMGIPIAFGPKGDLVGSSVFILKVQGNDFVQVPAGGR